MPLVRFQISFSSLVLSSLDCLVCSDCHVSLTVKCYLRNGQVSKKCRFIYLLSFVSSLVFFFSFSVRVHWSTLLSFFLSLNSSSSSRISSPIVRKTSTNDSPKLNVQTVNKVSWFNSSEFISFSIIHMFFFLSFLSFPFLSFPFLPVSLSLSLTLQTHRNRSHCNRSASSGQCLSSTLLQLHPV